MSGSSISPSSRVLASIPSSSDDEDILYCYAVGVLSRIDEKKLDSIRSWYQIPNDLNPHLVVRGEWCCSPRLGVGIYEAYLLRGLRLPFNAFTREILHRLGLLYPCRCCGGRLLMGTVLSPWMSSFIVLRLLRLANPQAFINFLQGVPIVGWLGPFLHRIGGGRWSSFSS